MAQNNQPIHAINSIFIDQDLLTNPGNGNNKFIFNFPKNIKTTAHSKMSVANFSVPYSWFNVTARLGNNKYKYIWYDSDNNTTGTTWDVNMPDGYYDISIMNAYLQFTMIQNGHYLIDQFGNFVYFLEWAKNPNLYRDQLNSYQVPGVLPGGWTIPIGPFPGGAGGGVHYGGPDPPMGDGFKCPQIVLSVLPSSQKADIFTYFGFLYPLGTPSPPPIGTSRTIPVGPYPTVNNTSISTLGDNAPNENVVHAVSLTCNYIDNPLRSNGQHEVGTTVVTTQNVDVPFGTNIANSNFFTTWIPLLGEQNIRSMTFELKDQEGDPIMLQDPNSNIELLITDLRYS